MWQEQREPAEALPLGLAGADELVDDDLRTVGEVTVLAFPHDERIRLGCGVAVLEAHYRLFRQHRINHLYTGLVIGDVLQGGVGFVAVLVVQNGVTMEERAATAVLTRNTDRE